MLQLSQRVKQLHASPIREILAVIDKPGIISFAGGLPSNDTFTVPDLSAFPSDMLQYGTSEGEMALRIQISNEMQMLGLNCTPGQVLVLSGSQQGIDLLAKLVVDAGTQVAVESPTYLAALQVFRFFGADFSSFDPANAAQSLCAAGKPALCYTVPTFQNPTGRCYTLEQRQSLAAICEQEAVLLFEDDPYRDLVYDACERKPVCSFMRSGHWVYQGSFSKSVAPGLRLGFLVCSEQLVIPLTRLKQAADLHSNRLAQYWILQLLQQPERQHRLHTLQASYRQKRDRFAALLAETLGGLADWQLPAGGLFFWLRLRQSADTRQLLVQALAQGLAFMPGEAFFHDPAQVSDSYLRLNFSHASEQQMISGLNILKKLLVSSSASS